MTHPRRMAASHEPSPIDSGIDSWGGASFIRSTRLQTKPWDEDLLDFLAISLRDDNYDLKKLLELIATSESYQSQVEIIEGPQSGDYVFRGPRSRRLTAEQFLDSVWQITGTAPGKFDAPVFRTKVSPEEKTDLKLEG